VGAHWIKKEDTIIYSALFETIFQREYSYSNDFQNRE
jgi:hypothetical protein